MEQHERSGVLVLRVWTEPWSEGPPLRATIRTRDLEAAEPTEVTAAGLPRIVDVVRAWLEEFDEPLDG